MGTNQYQQVRYKTTFHPIHIEESLCVFIDFLYPFLLALQSFLLWNTCSVYISLMIKKYYAKVLKIRLILLSYTCRSFGICIQEVPSLRVLYTVMYMYLYMYSIYILLEIKVLPYIYAKDLKIWVILMNYIFFGFRTQQVPGLRPLLMECQEWRLPKWPSSRWSGPVTPATCTNGRPTPTRTPCRPCRCCRSNNTTAWCGSRSVSLFRTTTGAWPQMAHRECSPGQGCIQWTSPKVSIQAICQESQCW